MNIVNNMKLSVAAFALAAALPAAAQQPAAQAAVGPGTIVKDDKGAEVGTVARVEGETYIIKTDKHEVPIARASVTPHEGALLFGMTRDQLNAAVEQQLAKKDAAITTGATVLGSAGTPAGTIDAVDPEFVTLKLPSGKAVRLPRTALALGQSGLVTGATAEQLEAAAASAGTQ
ncbi:hypothetical protein [Allosphingosinicella deserti]|uniref:Preprotein translocase subunit YajC n=1 Tax=Allosphingosinicella deserti TaxID=2116704 RepID=A0A2P7QZ89_9SPHN|nr:hypothetical protein [Sphingomonas deserti]PSJ43277.1 hypothetical protein C7I55_02565 [Sphingomonas deserti]